MKGRERGEERRDGRMKGRIERQRSEQGIESLDSVYNQRPISREEGRERIHPWGRFHLLGLLSSELGYSLLMKIVDVGPEIAVVQTAQTGDGILLKGERGRKNNKENRKRGRGEEKGKGRGGEHDIEESREDPALRGRRRRNHMR